MIARLRGILIEKNPPCLLVEVGGVAYECQAPITTSEQCVEGHMVTLCTHWVQRDEGPQLYAFSTAGERDLFRILIRVNGVGPKSALAILSGMSKEAFIHCVETEDLALLTRIPGIGKKTAAKILLDIRDKLADWVSVAPSKFTTQLLSRPPVAMQAIQALMSLGYSQSVATQAVQAVPLEGKSCEDIIKSALQGFLPQGGMNVG